MERNNTSFPLLITSKIKELHSLYEKDNKWYSLLKYFQYIAKYIIIDKEYRIKDSRGLLLYFTMGIGKTRTAAAIALSVTSQNVVVIVPKGLQSNFSDTLKYIEEKTGLHKDKHKIKYVSSDAYNSASQLSKVDNYLDNAIIIIDEAHNFFRAVISGSQESNAYKIYDQLMRARNIRILLMTGTPISKNPFELVPCVNLLAGFDLLPIQYEQFNDLYVDKENKSVRNREYLANRLVGLVSYMTVSDKSMFPTELPTIISKEEMSEPQYRQYLQAREIEELNKKNNIITRIDSKAMMLPKQSNMSSYYIKSRSLSNFVYLNEHTDFTKVNSPKMWLITSRILEAKGLVLVYSQFVNEHGLKQLTYYLQQHNFSNYTGDNSESLRYALYTGDVDSKLRDKILTTFNSDENKYGSIIKVILVSKTGAEGLNLLNVRETHQMEPYWDLSRNKQVKSRAIRYGSHLALPESERTVQPYLYISTANKKMQEGMKEKEYQTIDEIFYERALEQDIINSSFNDLLKDVSIECSYFKTAQCYICNPTNEKLFNKDPLIDIKIKNPCTPYHETEKDAISIIIDDNEFYYTENPFHVYRYDNSLDGYVEVSNDNPIIEKIYKTIYNNIDN